MTRKPIPSDVQADVLTRSRRRCALCYFIDDNKLARPGQIAHLNGNSSNSNFENLVFLCLEHHDKYDSKTSQTKNYTQIEVVRWRDKLYEKHSTCEYSKQEVVLLQEYLRKYSYVFTYILAKYTELASKIDYSVRDSLIELCEYWDTNNLRSFNPHIREIQDLITTNINDILGVYELHIYDWIEQWIRFDSQNFSLSILQSKEVEIKGFVDAIAYHHKRLDNIAVQ